MQRILKNLIEEIKKSGNLIFRFDEVNEILIIVNGKNKNEKLLCEYRKFNKNYGLIEYSCKFKVKKFLFFYYVETMYESKEIKERIKYLLRKIEENGRGKTKEKK